MPAVGDSSPLILFARARYLHLLRSLYREVWVPPSVAGESFRDSVRPGSESLMEAAKEWLREVVPADTELLRSLHAEVDSGEAAAITLAVEHRLLLVIDDLDGRRSARSRGVRVTGSAGVLVAAKEAGLLQAVRPALDRLILEGLWLSRPLYHQVLADVGEAPAAPNAGRG
jgi:uncharacterized protein